MTEFLTAKILDMPRSFFQCLFLVEAQLDTLIHNFLFFTFFYVLHTCEIHEDYVLELTALFFALHRAWLTGGSVKSLWSEQLKNSDKIPNYLLSWLNDLPQT